MIITVLIIRGVTLVLIKGMVRLLNSRGTIKIEWWVAPPA